ncbi:hypothetical protein WJX82_003911 [Trebouxia sp. C0006]
MAAPVADQQAAVAGATQAEDGTTQGAAVALPVAVPAAMAAPVAGKEAAVASATQGQGATAVVDGDEVVGAATGAVTHEDFKSAAACWTLVPGSRSSTFSPGSKLLDKVNNGTSIFFFMVKLTKAVGLFLSSPGASVSGDSGYGQLMAAAKPDHSRPSHPSSCKHSSQASLGQRQDQQLQRRLGCRHQAFMVGRKMHTPKP